MAIYTVHEPPLKADEVVPDPERFVFVRDGFSFWAFLLAPLWMLRHRLWLVLAGYVLVTIALQVALRLIGASATVTLAISVLLALLVGFEAATLRRFTLSRRRWKNVGIVVGDAPEAAEQRFFDAWFEDASSRNGPVRSEPRTSLPSALPIMRRPSSEVIGLFPEPGAHR